MGFLFKNYPLVKGIYLLIRCWKGRFFRWNTNNTDINGVNKQNTHTHTPNTLEKITFWKGLVSMKISDANLSFKTTPLIKVGGVQLHCGFFKLRK